LAFERVLAGVKLAREATLRIEQTRAVRVRQKALGRELQRLFDDVVHEPVPEEFLHLLKRLDEMQDDPAKRPH
jgi:hypothetical protein